jgi:hypothetical protein
VATGGVAAGGAAWGRRDGRRAGAAARLALSWTWVLTQVQERATFLPIGQTDRSVWPMGRSMTCPTSPPQEAPVLTIPSAFHEVLGERQDPRMLAAIGAVGLGGTALLIAAERATFTAVPTWQAALAALLVLDVICGALANFSPGTSDYYATRPRHRAAFLAIHVHLVAIALLLGTGLLPAVGVWVVTIAAAVVVTTRRATSTQLQIAAAVVVAAGVTVPILFAGSTVMTAVSLLFVLKVVLAFGVDHYGTGIALRAGMPAEAGSDAGADATTFRSSMTGTVADGEPA